MFLFELTTKGNAEIIFACNFMNIKVYNYINKKTSRNTNNSKVLELHNTFSKLKNRSKQ